MDSTVAEIADEPDIRIGDAIVGRVTGEHDLAVALDGEPARNAEAAAGRVDDLAIERKCRIRAAVGVVANEREVSDGHRGRYRPAGGTRHEDLAIRLDAYATRDIGAAGNVSARLAGGAKARIERAVGVEAGEREIVLADLAARVRHAD